jgi:hypothetical protein
MAKWTRWSEQAPAETGYYWSRSLRLNTSQIVWVNILGGVVFEVVLIGTSATAMPETLTDFEWQGPVLPEEG